MAAPRTTAEPPTRSSSNSGEGLSAQTLIIAAIASAIAAIVVSRLWGQGTIIASAITPVLVALVSEALRKPIQSERVRRPVRAVGSTAAARVPRVSTREEARPPSGRTPNVMAPQPPGVDDGLRQREEGVEPGPVKVYSSGSNRRPRDPGRGGGPDNRRVKVALATGLIAFLVAAVALTLPELIFGGSVTGGKRDTTYFGGGKSSSDKGEEQDGRSGGQEDAPTEEGSPSDSGDDQAPGSQDPAPDSRTPAPAPPSEPAPTTTQPPPEAPSQPAPTP